MYEIYTIVGERVEGTYLINFKWEVVVAQLVERSLLIPEVRSSSPVIGKNLLILNNYCML